MLWWWWENVQCVCMISFVILLKQSKNCVSITKKNKKRAKEQKKSVHTLFSDNFIWFYTKNNQAHSLSSIYYIICVCVCVIRDQNIETWPLFDYLTKWCWWLMGWISSKKFAAYYTMAMFGHFQLISVKSMLNLRVDVA